MKTSPLLRSLVLSLTLLTSVPSFAAVKKEFNVCWTIYAGWMPWGAISNEKIIDKWASKYGIKINIVQLNDYIESINQYTAGQFDGCTMTNMDALTIPAAGGVDSTALITGSYSDGNDGVVLKGADKKLSDLKGMSVYLPELSVSHYLLVRGLGFADAQRQILWVRLSGKHPSSQQDRAFSTRGHQRSDRFDGGIYRANIGGEILDEACHRLGLQITVMHGRGVEVQHIHAAGLHLYLANEFHDTGDIAGVRHATFRG